MKKLIFLFFLAIFASTSIAQDLSNQFYFRIGYSSPSWSQHGLNEGLWGGQGFEKKHGAQFEFGSIFMLRSILDSDDFSFGINADYLYVNFNNFAEKHTAKNMNLGSLRIGSKVGPSFTYSPMDKMGIDIFVKADLAWATAAVFYDDKPGDADDYFLGYAKVGVSTGLNFRYGLLILGFEFNTVSPELESDDFKDVYLQQVINAGFGLDSNETKSKMPVLNFTVGISF